MVTFLLAKLKLYNGYKSQKSVSETLTLNEALYILLLVGVFSDALIDYTAKYKEIVVIKRFIYKLKLQNFDFNIFWFEGSSQH